MSDLRQHADRELRAAGYSPDAKDKMDHDIWLATMEIVRVFSTVGHSGYSAMYHIDMIKKLLSYETLTEITDNPEDWIDVGESFVGQSTWQNRRDGRMFSHDGGLTYYNVDQLRYGWRRRLFGRTGPVYTSHTYKGDRHA